MDIKTLSDEFFSKCDRYYEVGKLYSQKDQVYFTSLINNKTEKIDTKDISENFVDKNNHKIKINTVKSILAKRLIRQEDVPFLIISSDEMTFNDEPLNRGDIVLFTNPIIIYSNLSPLFDMECKKTFKYDKEKARNAYKSGNRSNRYTDVDRVEQKDVDVTNNDFENLKGSFKTLKNTSRNIPRAIEEDIGVSNNSFSNVDNIFGSNTTCKLVAILFQETKTGGSSVWGYKVKQGRNISNIPLMQIKRLAKKGEIENAKLVSREGKTFLQGIGESISDLPKEWV